ncbi:MAG: hypothetical protein M1835_003998 [Candelina submexicana]|nr:MAG: hypothetical protein M1835_003998 [Candelina submexicana]
MFEAILERLRQEPPLGEDTKVYENRGTPYAITQEEINVIQDRHKSYKRPLFHMSKHKAAQLIIDAHARGVHLDRDQLAAIDRLQGLSKLTRWGSDIAIKAFNDLDKIFFMGVLRGNVYLRWSDKSERGNWGGRTHSHCIGRRIMIQLSTKVLQTSLASLRDVWSTLLHEMIHAYLYHQCGSSLVDDDDELPGHGPIFQACMKAIQYRIGNPSFIKLRSTHSILDRPSWYTKGGYRRDDGRESHRVHRRNHHNDDDNYEDDDDYDEDDDDYNHRSGHHHRRRHRY